MKMMTAFLSSMLFLSPVFAHEGHDHDAPAMVQAPRGGMIKSVEDAHIEVILKKNDLKIYVYDKDLKIKDPKTVNLKAQTQLPRAKAAQNLPLIAKEDRFEASFDAKGAHRYSLVLTYKHEGEDHADKLTFNLEPKK
ncbi:MAG: hypothetical protein KF681_09995 [Bdellovibrionaceae bacterium]|nr:hypothetical protein [Pseudobdellovibrionaceae bacterium]